MPKIDNAFGRAPESFTRFVEDTLRQKQREEQKPMRHKTINGALIFALVIVLLAGTAFALTNGFGLIQFKERTGMTVLPETQNMIVDLSGTQTAESPLVRYQLLEALVDGERLMLTLAAEPLEPGKYVLMGGMELPDFPREEGSPTYEELAAAEGKTLLLIDFPSISIDGVSGSGSMDFIYQDGKILYYLAAEGLPLDAETLDIACKFVDYEVYGMTTEVRKDGTIAYPLDRGEVNRTETTIELTPKRVGADTLRFEGPFACERMDVNWIELRRTPVATYLSLEYTAHTELTEEDREAMEIMFFHLRQSADDVEFRTGGAGGSTIVRGENPDGTPDGVTYLEETEWPAMEAFPETIYLRPYYKLLGEWGDAIVLNSADGM